MGVKAIKKIYLIKRYKNFECLIGMSILLNDCILFSGPNLGTDKEYIQDLTSNASQQVTAKFRKEYIDQIGKKTADTASNSDSSEAN